MGKTPCTGASIATTLPLGRAQGESRFFGTHGAYCDIQDKQELCFSEACVFFQWKKANVLRHMEPGYFWPCFHYYTEELILRGMQEWVRQGPA